MKLARIELAGRMGVAVDAGRGPRVRFDVIEGGDISELLRGGVKGLLDAATEIERTGSAIDVDDVVFLPPLPHPRKIVCVGLNYRDHAHETGFKVPDYPTLFARFDSSLIGHRQPIQSTALSTQLDYEGEMVAVIGETTRERSEPNAADAVFAYSVFNDVSLRDYQMRSPQWTPGKNFDGTGAFGPWLVTADELPTGAAGLHIETRLNGKVVQSASTSDMIFDVATLVATLSEFMTLEPGDVIVTGTPSGVGMSHDPPLWMRPGDSCEVELEGVGILQNPIT